MQHVTKAWNVVYTVACTLLQVLKYFWDLASLDEVGPLFTPVSQAYGDKRCC